MERMEGVDAGYLYLETPTMHMHTLKVAIIEPASRVRLRRVHRRAASAGSTGCRRSSAGSCRCRSRSTTRCGSPTSDIDPARHVFHHRLPAAGGHARAGGAGRARSPAPRSTASCRCGRCTSARGWPTARSPSSARCTTPSPTARPPTRCSPTSPTTPRPTVPRTPTGAPEPAARHDGAQVRLALARRRSARLFTLPALLWRTGRAVRPHPRSTKRESPSAVPRPVLDVPRTSFNGAADPAPQLRHRARCRSTSSRRSARRTA